MWVEPNFFLWVSFVPCFSFTVLISLPQSTTVKLQLRNKQLGVSRIVTVELGLATHANDVYTH